MTKAEQEAAIADVFAMMGGCAQVFGGGSIQQNRRKKYQPKTEFGRRVEEIVAREIAAMKTKS